MPANYNGVLDGAVVPGSTITISQPVDGDNLTAASANVPTARLADLLKTIIDNAMWKGSPTAVAGPVTVGTAFDFVAQTTFTWAFASYAVKGTAAHAAGRGVEGSGGLVGVRGLTSTSVGSGVKGYKDLWVGGLTNDRAAVWGEAVATLTGEQPVGMLGTAVNAFGDGAAWGGYFIAGSPNGAAVFAMGDPTIGGTAGFVHGVWAATKGDGAGQSAAVRGEVVSGNPLNRGGWFTALATGTGVYASGLTGVVGESAQIDGSGVVGITTAAGGIGVTGQGVFGGVFSSTSPGSPGVWARMAGGASAGDPAVLAHGAVQLDPATSNPAVGSATAKNRITARTIPRTWLVLDCNGTANPGVLGASYGAVTQGTGGAQGTITVNLPIAMASATNYFVMIVESGVTSIPALWPVTIVSATQFTAAPVRTLTGVAVTGAEASGKKLFILVFGDQA